MTPYYTSFQPVVGGAKRVDYTGTAGSTEAMPINCSAVWIVVTTDAFVRTGGTAVADTDLYVRAYTPVIIDCAGSAVVSAVQVTAGGTLYAQPII